MLDKYKRLDGETLEEFELRICELNEQTGEFDDWQSIADVVNENFGTTYTECKVRKDYNTFKKMLPCYLKKHGETTSNCQQLEAIKLEIQKEKQKLYDQRKEFNALARKAARSENLEDRLVAAIENINEDAPLVDFCDIGFTYNNDTEAVLVLSDWHYGMTTDNIWNEYNVEICKQRVSELRHQVVKKLKLFRPKKLHIIQLGDMCHGALHVTARIQSEEDTCDQLMNVSEIIAELINELSGYVDDVEFYNNYGNHMRTVQDKKESVHSDNMEKLIAFYLKARLKDVTNLHFVDSEYYEFTLLTVLGYNIVAMHGDLEKAFNDIGTNMNMLFSKKYGVTVDYTISADKHHLQAIDKFGVQSFLAPALCGTDDYANGVRAYSLPSQLFMIFNERGLDDLINIRLDF